MSKESKQHLQRQPRSPRDTASPSQAMALKWLALLAIHYKIELTEPEIEIYLDGLKEFGPKQLDDAFALCRKECLFMPRVADIVSRIAPEKTYFEPDPPMYSPPEDKATWAKLMAENGAEIRKQPSEPMPGQRWTAEDGWLPREESWRLEAEREARKKPAVAWHARIAGPNIRA